MAWRDFWSLREPSEVGVSLGAWLGAGGLRFPEGPGPSSGAPPPGTPGRPTTKEAKHHNPPPHSRGFEFY